jgi:predicted RNase H-like HicB family nuclease
VEGITGASNEILKYVPFMTRMFTMEYWLDEGWYVGKLKEVPGVFSQGETLQDLEENIRDAYKLMLEEGAFTPPVASQVKEVGVEIGSAAPS